MSDPISASIVFPLLNFAWRSVQTGYELAGVPSATQDHLKTISQVLLDIQTARDLRNQKAGYLTDNEVICVDTTIKNTEEALAGLEALVERARVDMQLHGNTVRAPARIMWVMRDSGMANAALSRLSLTSQSLHSQISMMRSIQCSTSRISPNSVRPHLSRVRSPSHSDYGVDSPSHLLDTTKAIAERREWLSRRYSVRRDPASPSPSHARPQTLFEPPPLEESEMFINARQNVADWIRDNESVLSDVDPDSFAGPRDELLRARVIDTDEQWMSRYPNGLAELDSIPFATSVSQAHHFSASMPSSPHPPSSTPVADIGYEAYRTRSETSAIPGHPRPFRQSLSPANPFRPLNESRVTQARSMTAQTPGRRGERLLTWEEPTYEEEEERTSHHTVVPSNVVDSPPPYSSVATPHVAPVNRTGASNAVGMEGRRAARVHNTQHPPSVQPVVTPNLHTTTPSSNETVTASRSATVRGHRSRPSRSEWALEQHESEAASISSRRTSRERY